MFICNHCPFVIHLKKDIVKLSNFYMKVSRKLIPFSFFSDFTHYMLSLLAVSSVVEKNRITSRSSCLLQKGLAVVAISSNSVVTHPQVEILYNLWSLDFVRLLCDFVVSFSIFHRMDLNSWLKMLSSSNILSLIFMMRFAFILSSWW